MPDVWSDSNTMSPTLFMVLYFTLIPNTVSVVAVSDVAYENTFAPMKLELVYAVASSNDVWFSSYMLNNGGWLRPVLVCVCSQNVVLAL